MSLHLWTCINYWTAKPLSWCWTGAHARTFHCTSQRSDTQNLLLVVFTLVYTRPLYWTNLVSDLMCSFQAPVCVFYTDNSIILILKMSTINRDSAVAIATGYGLDDRGVRVRVPGGARIFSSPCRQIGSGAHPASYPMDTGSSFSGGEVKTAEAWSWLLTCN
jgi:hypothetical protein